VGERISFCDDRIVALLNSDSDSCIQTNNICAEFTNDEFLTCRRIDALNGAT
jgi:hypothetical protein